jgi:arylsulfatase A-like enzyme
MQTDACVGEVLAALEKNGVAENTLLIFTSDNGCSPEANFEELETQGHFPSARFRGMKSDVWEGGLRVPFLVQWPAKLKSGTKSDALVCLTDFIATAADLIGAGLPESAAEDSFSFLPELLATGKGARTHVVQHSLHGQFAIREGDWKLLFCPGSGGWSQPGDVEARRQGLPAVQLYDLSSDPGETRNLHLQHPEVVQRLTELMGKIAAEGRSTPGGKRENDTVVDFRKPRPQAP